MTSRTMTPLANAYTNRRCSLGMAFLAVLFVVLWLVMTWTLLTGDAEYVSYVIGSVTGGFLLLCILLRGAIWFGRLNLPSFFMACYVVVLLVPSIVRFFEMDDPIRYTFLVAMGSVLWTFPIGVGIANFMLYKSFAQRSMKLPLSDNIKRLDHDLAPVFAILFFVSIVVFAVVIAHMPFVPLQEAVRSDTSVVDPVRLRFAVVELPRELHFSYELIRRAVLPACTIYAYLMSVRYKSYWMVVFPMLFVFTLFVTIFFLDRGPLVTLFSLPLFSWLLVRNQKLSGLVRPWPILIVVAAMLASGAMTVLQYGGNFSWQSGISSAWYVFSVRLFNPALWASRVFMDYNYDLSFLYGRSVRLFAVIGRGEYVESLIRPPIEVGPVSFVADLWRQWGWPGVIVGSIVLGCLYQYVDRKYLCGDTDRDIAVIVCHTTLLGGSTVILYGNLFGVMSLSIFLIGVLASVLAHSRQTGQRPAKGR